jgi:hypothetical protein
MASSPAPPEWRGGFAGLWQHERGWLKGADPGRKLGTRRRGAKSGRHNSYQGVPPGMFIREGDDAKKDLV